MNYGLCVCVRVCVGMCVRVCIYKYLKYNNSFTKETKTLLVLLHTYQSVHHFKINYAIINM